MSSGRSWSSSKGDIFGKVTSRGHLKGRNYDAYCLVSIYAWHHWLLHTKRFQHTHLYISIKCMDLVFQKSEPQSKHYSTHLGRNYFGSYNAALPIVPGAYLVSSMCTFYIVRFFGFLPFSQVAFNKLNKSGLSFLLPVQLPVVSLKVASSEVCYSIFLSTKLPTTSTLPLTSKMFADDYKKSTPNS